MTIAATWDEYDAAKLAYDAAHSAWVISKTKRDNEISGKIAAIAATKAAAEKLSAEIETLYLSRQSELLQWAQDWVDSVGLARSSTANPDGLVEVDPERIIDTRFYIATHVNDWGEESAPSPPTTLLEVDQYSVVTVTRPALPSGRNLAGWRLYRSNEGSTEAAFQSVTDLDTSKAVLIDGAFNYFRGDVTSYVDSKKAAELQEICPTVTWLEPPAREAGGNPYLRGLVGMPNGVMAGFVDNFVAFCDPYHPYAWPVEYQISLEYPVVGLGVFGQTLFVGTTANPYLISGSDSASMSSIKLDAAQACVSARSIVALQGGVVYASPDGLCVASNAGVELLTGALFAREDWQLLTPSSMVAAAHEGVYYFWYSGNGGGCYALDTVAQKLTKVAMSASAVFTDSLTDAVFYVSGAAIKRAFSTGRRTGLWHSGKMVLGASLPLAWLQVDGDQSADVPATVRWYGDGVLRHTASVTGIAPVRLPPGRYLEHEIEIESAARITKVLLTGSTEELKNG